MNFREIDIIGLRGFGNKQKLKLAEPNSDPGSGLTIIVGPNNSGKSTIYEAFRALSQRRPPSITEGRRNKAAGDKIEIQITKSDGNSLILRTLESGGSETEFHQNGLDRVRFFTLPSRRSFSPFFSKGEQNREEYIQNAQLSAVRGSQLDNFYMRLFKIQNNQGAYNEILSKILGQVPTWHIEQSDSGQYYLKFNYNGAFHNSDGTGEGLLSIFTIVDTLYDSTDGDLIFIDEPELSLHPSLQRKLLKLLLEYTATRQIVVSTHSPYFISWSAITNGGKIARTVKEANGIKIYQLDDSTATRVTPLLNNLNNPHILGLDAREIFFLDDNIILVEGQEDVIFLKRILELKGKQLNGYFYGWGVGGATNTDKVLQMLKDLGFKKVAVVLDNNMNHLVAGFKAQFPDYHFSTIPCDDIRDKVARPEKPAIEGLINTGGTTINPKYDMDIDTLCDEINTYLT